MTIGLVYLALLGLGVVYALIASAAGMLGDAGDVHVDASGHLDAGHPSPLSPTLVATFITGFGGGGAVAHYLLEWGTVPGLLTATGSGVMLAAAAFAILESIFKQTQAGAEFHGRHVAGRDAEVITAIPAGGTGEIAFVVKGQRESAPARAIDGAPVPKGSLVVIEKVAGSTAFVRVKS
jgi:membrane protein implicated in regulation of membrane protease activity